MTRLLLRDDELVPPGRKDPRWQVLDTRPRYGCIKLLDCETHQEKYEKVADLNEAIVAGHLLVRRQGAPRHSVAAQNDPNLDERLRTALAVLREVEEVQRRQDLSFSKAYDVVRDQRAVQGQADLPSRATLYRYAEAKRNGLPLLRGDKNKGNRTPRYEERIVQLVCDAANGLFLNQGSRWTLRSLTDYVNARATEFGWLGKNARISRTFVSKTITENLSADPEIERMDPRLVSAAKSVAKRRIFVMTPFERVEQDALHLPFVVATPHGPASNVWLVHAIDVGTGVPAGWVSKLGSPTASDGLRCVESILFPKTALLATLGLTTTLEVHGTPHLLVFDNGPEARSERMHRLVRLDIDAKHCRAREAQGKPFIERLNKALKEGLETLPGCTRMDGKDGQRDPVALGDKLMTLEELERWIVRWYYEDWCNRPLKRHLRTDFFNLEKLGSTPAERWRRMTGELGFAMPLSPSLSEWRMTLYEHEYRTLSRKTGVTYRGFNYRGDHLPYLVDKYGERKVKVLANPDDFREVFIDDGEDRPLVPLVEEFTDDSTPAFSFKEAEEMRRSAPVAEVPGAGARQKFQDDVRAHSVQVPASKPRKPSRAEQNKAVVGKTNAALAVHRAVANPLHAARPSVTSSTVRPGNDDGLGGMSFDDVAPVTVRSRTGGDGAGS